MYMYTCIIIIIIIAIIVIIIVIVILREAQKAGELRRGDLRGAADERPGPPARRAAPRADGIYV